MKCSGIVLAAVVCAGVAGAQTAAPGAKPAGRIIGEVTAVDTAARTLSLKPDQGGAVAVTLTEKALFLRVPPGEKDLTKASRISFSDITAGDRVLARGQVSEDQKSIAANAIIVMTKADLAQMHQKKREEWQKRGAAGTVASVDAAGKRFIVNTRTREGVKPLTVETSEKTELWRYAPDSVRFSEAKPSSFGEIQAGDQVRVLGDKNAEGTSVAAEQIVSGSFRQVAGTILAVNADAGEIRITDLSTKKPLTVKVNSESSLKKLPPMVAEMLARRLNPAGAAVAGGPGRPGGERAGGPGGGAPPEGAAMRGQGGPGGPGGFGGMRGQGGPPDMQQMMERMPALNLSELKTGDAIIVSSAAPAGAERLTAIALVAGVEPLLRAAPERAVNFGGWSFGEIGMPE
jgi:hypothetical protein